MLLQMAIFHPFLWLCNIHYIYIYTHIYIHCIFFMHSSVDGHLDCFLVLAIVSMNIMVCVSF